MSETQERTVKALRRAFREFTEGANKMGAVRLTWQVDEREGGGLPTMDFYAHVEIEE